MSTVLRNMFTRIKYPRSLLPLNRSLSLTNSHLHLEGEVRRAGGKGRAQLLARGLCRFRYIPFHDLSKGDRLGHLRVQLMAWTPFRQNEFAIVMTDSGAAVFAWDQQAFLQRCEEAGLASDCARPVPESLMHPALHQGVILRRCVDGCEGQVWREGMLVASRWWPQIPDAMSWLNFQRSAAVSPEDQLAGLPTCADEVAWNPSPWAPIKTLSELLEKNRLYKHAILALCLLLLVLPTLWLGKSWIVLDAHVAALAQENLRLEAAAGPILQARTESLDALDSLDAIAERVGHASPVELLAHISRLLPKDGTILRELDWQGNRVRLVLFPPAGASRIAYVEAIEGGGWLQNVRELDPGRDKGVVLVADLVGTSPLVMTDKGQESPSSAQKGEL